MRAAEHAQVVVGVRAELAIATGGEERRAEVTAAACTSGDAQLDTALRPLAGRYAFTLSDILQAAARLKAKQLPNERIIEVLNEAAAAASAHGHKRLRAYLREHVLL